MSIHIIFGDMGAGKTALMTAILADAYRERGEELLEQSRTLIRRENVDRLAKLSYPKKVPFYTTPGYSVNIDGYTPYTIEGAEVGVSGEYEETDDEGKEKKTKESYKSLFLGSWLFVDEVQTVFPSDRKMRAGQKEFFTKSRHARYEIYLAGPRGISAHKDIRAVASQFIHVLKSESFKSPFGKLVKTRWYVREFTKTYAFEAYLQANYDPAAVAGEYVEKMIEFKGNVYDLYDPYGQVKSFLPKDKEGEDFAT